MQQITYHFGKLLFCHHQYPLFGLNHLVCSTPVSLSLRFGLEITLWNKLPVLVWAMFAYISKYITLLFRFGLGLIVKSIVDLPLLVSSFQIRQAVYSDLFDFNHLVSPTLRFLF